MGRKRPHSDTTECITRSDGAQNSHISVFFEVPLAFVAPLVSGEASGGGLVSVFCACSWLALCLFPRSNDVGHGGFRLGRDHQTIIRKLDLQSRPCLSATRAPLRKRDDRSRKDKTNRSTKTDGGNIASALLRTRQRTFCRGAIRKGAYSAQAHPAYGVGSGKGARQR
jgi:hypothetical protein